MNFRSSLAKAKGYGAAHKGTATWLWERVTALLLIPLVLWLGFVLVKWPGMDTNTVRYWIADPFHAVLLTITIVLTVVHAQMGLHTVLEDYVHSTGLRFSLLLLIRSGFVLLGLCSIMAIWPVSMGS
ncbi:MAG: succinate dehydrogenase, hydrophobic membrane anchor protein [Methylococcaceae bacterium]